jgi:hypothetical protein
MTKQTLGNRSFINQVKYSPKFQSVAILGTNDANAWIGFNLGTGVASQATWVNVTGGNAVLPNRPVLGMALDPTVPAANVPIGYAAVGGFNANTPTNPGHVFRVVCDANCVTPTWADKSGNLPDIPVASIIVNPNFAQQVFAGTDWGLYYTNDITVASPTWYRFENGIPHSMIWDMQIDRGSTTLSVWTRARGAYVWPLPSAPVLPLAPSGIVSRKTHGAAGIFDIDLGLDGSGVECRNGGANGDYTMVFSFGNNLASVGSASVTSGTGSVASSMIGADPHQYIVNLTGVTNAQQLTVTVNNVQDSFGNFTPAISGTMKVLIGDTSSNHSVNSSDVTQTKARIGQLLNASNFRSDINFNNAINATDAAQVKSNVGTGLP